MAYDLICFRKRIYLMVRLLHLLYAFLLNYINLQYYFSHSHLSHTHVLHNCWWNFIILFCRPSLINCLFQPFADILPRLLWQTRETSTLWHRVGAALIYYFSDFSYSSFGFLCAVICDCFVETYFRRSNSPHHYNLSSSRAVCSLSALLLIPCALEGYV